MAPVEAHVARRAVDFHAQSYPEAVQSDGESGTEKRKNQEMDHGTSLFINTTAEEYETKSQ